MKASSRGSVDDRAVSETVPRGLLLIIAVMGIVFHRGGRCGRSSSEALRPAKCVAAHADGRHWRTVLGEPRLDMRPREERVVHGARGGERRPESLDERGRRWAQLVGTARVDRRPDDRGVAQAARGVGEDEESRP